MHKQQGFTLIELIIVILIMGILAYGSVQFILNTSGAYADSQQRTRLGLVATTTMERLTRELQSALPGSLRVSSNGQHQCLEFLPISQQPQQQTPSQRRHPSHQNTTRYYHDQGTGTPGSGYYSLPPVSFCLVEERLYRYSGYGLASTQPIPSELPSNTQQGRLLLADQIRLQPNVFQVVGNTRGQQNWLLLTLDFVNGDDHLLLQQEVRLAND